MANPCLGQDREGHKYWHFYKDPTRIYVWVPHKEEEALWMYLDSTKDFERLANSLNLKGIKDNTLHDNLMKVKVYLQLKE